jgi:hypothetical protein
MVSPQERKIFIDYIKKVYNASVKKADIFKTFPVLVQVLNNKGMMYKDASSFLKEIFWDMKNPNVKWDDLPMEEFEYFITALNPELKKYITKPLTDKFGIALSGTSPSIFPGVSPEALAGKKYEFMVEYPWGSNYVEEVASAAAELGYEVVEDLWLEGSDTAGVFICKSAKDAKQIKKLLKKYTEMEWDGEDDKQDPYQLFYSEIDNIDCANITQDWKHLEWEGDKKFLKNIGLKLSQKKGEEDIFILEKI